MITRARPGAWTNRWWPIRRARTAGGADSVIPFLHRGVLRLDVGREGVRRASRAGVRTDRDGTPRPVQGLTDLKALRGGEFSAAG